MKEIMIYVTESTQYSHNKKEIVQIDCQYIGSNLETARKEGRYSWEHLVEAEKKRTTIGISGYLLEEGPEDTFDSMREKLEEAMLGNPDYYEVLF